MPLPSAVGTSINGGVLDRWLVILTEQWLHLNPKIVI
jgi:hypothetical protein